MALTAVYRKFSTGYIAFIEELPGANTQGKTLKETKRNLVEAVKLTLEANRKLSEEGLIGEDVIREPFLLPMR
jgi:predicted RNase H-like HicB family nuclease